MNEDFITTASSNSSLHSAYYINPICNQSSLYYSDYTQIYSIRIILITVWSLVTFITFIGNVIVVVAICSTPSLATVTNYYITNMAVIDAIIAILVMPLKLVEMAAPCNISIKIFSNQMCMISQYVFMILVFASLSTVIIISVKRYLVIVYPMKMHSFHNKQKTRLTITIIWAVPIFLSIPSMIYQQVQVSHITSEYGTIDRAFCFAAFPVVKLKIFIWLHFVIYYFLPLCVVSFTSIKIVCRLLQPISINGSPNCERSASRKSMKKMSKQENKRKVAKMILVIAFLYYLSWTPFYITQVVALHTDFLNSGQYFFTFINVLLISFFNSTANPIVYYIMSSKIRKSINLVISLRFKELGESRFIIQSFNQKSQVDPNNGGNSNKNDSLMVIQQYYTAL